MAVIPSSTLAIAGVIVFAVGVLSGFAAASAVTKVSNGTLRTGIAIAVTTIWIVTIVADILITGYTVSALVHGIMGALVGYLFSSDKGFTINIGA